MHALRLSSAWNAIWAGVALLLGLDGVVAALQIGSGPRISVRKCNEYRDLGRANFRYHDIAGGSHDIPAQCLMRTTNGSTAIQLREFPHMALIGTVDRMFCDGSLISEQFVLTSASCMLLANQHQTPKFVELNGNTHDIDHVSYNEPVSHSSSGLALIRLRHQVEFGPALRPVCLQQHEAIEPANLTPAKVLVTSNWRKQRQLWHSAADCQARLRSRSFDAQTQLCSSAVAATDPADPVGSVRRLGGGALLMKNEDQCTYKLLGVAPVAVQPNTTVFIRVRHHLEWIERVVWRAEV